MRLRVFEAPTSQQALARMREALGPDAIVVASRDVEGGVCITAAVETHDPDLGDMLRPVTGQAVTDRIEEALAGHATPRALIDRLLDAVRESGLEDAQLALAHALGDLSRRTGERATAPARVVLLGPCGCGKTAAVAKLAAATRLAGRRPRVASLDTGRAGGVARLQSLLEPLGLSVECGDGPEALTDPDIVDTGGVNPFRGRDLAAVAELLRQLRHDPVLVLPAGLEACDSGEIAANFAALGVRRMIVSKLDMARRLGGVLAAMEAGLRLWRVSIGPAVGSALLPLTPASLARLLLGEAQGSGEGAQ